MVLRISLSREFRAAEVPDAQIPGEAEHDFFQHGNERVPLGLFGTCSSRCTGARKESKDYFEEQRLALTFAATLKLEESETWVRPTP